MLWQVYNDVLIDLFRIAQLFQHIQLDPQFFIFSRKIVCYFQTEYYNCRKEQMKIDFLTIECYLLWLYGSDSLISCSFSLAISMNLYYIPINHHYSWWSMTNCISRRKMLQLLFRCLFGMPSKCQIIISSAHETHVFCPTDSKRKILQN